MSVPQAPTTVWLASYPKSGNTWMRAIVSALRTHRLLFDANQLGSGGQPHHVGAALPALGLDPRWLDRGELLTVRDHLLRRDPGHEADRADREPAAGAAPPRLRKTHEAYRPGAPGREPFPAAATRAAILVVRDPRDVACSSAPFFGVDLDEAVERMGVPRESRPHPFRETTDQPWATWSEHTASWLSPDVPFPVHLVRYEDLLVDAVAALLPVFAAVGLACTREELAEAVDRARFERLQEWERTAVFRETSPKTERFFRSGRSGGWREELSDEQVADLEADHSEMMARLGYDVLTGPAERAARADVRRSTGRQRGEWWRLPERLGLEVERGTVPEELPGAAKPRPWISVLPDEALLRFQGGAGLWVRGGHHVTVEWEPGPDDGDPSWLVQGWAVTLATLQRGGLSLHAATVRIGDEVVALAGRRGAGKSTTSMALRRAGHELLVDDVTLVDSSGSDGVHVLPYSRNVHLLPDAAASLGLDFDELPLLAGARRKAAFRPEEPAGDPVRLDRIVVLVTDAGVTEAGLVEVRGQARVAALMRHTDRDGVAPIILGRDRYFEQITRLATAVPVSVLRRPRDAASLAEVVRLVVEGLRRRGRD
ncbi:MAG: Sulfotransferase [Nocardioides sp.]|nr:Sulfotransferase [Nocardioides sp.]